MFNYLINAIRAAKTRHNSTLQERYIQNVKNRFTLCERNGGLYLLCENYPIVNIPASCTVAAAVRKLEEVREAALKYHGLTKAPNE